jgi:opacity protein-like surface antigen
VGAEGMVEWVTKAKFGSEHVHVGRAQWSGSGMLGVQYSLADHVAIFVEPKFTHYFNRLPLKTLRSEHDINMNVRVGLGFDF